MVLDVRGECKEVLQGPPPQLSIEVEPYCVVTDPLLDHVLVRCPRGKPNGTRLRFVHVLLHGGGTACVPLAQSSPGDARCVEVATPFLYSSVRLVDDFSSVSSAGKEG